MQENGGGYATGNTNIDGPRRTAQRHSMGAPSRWATEGGSRTACIQGLSVKAEAEFLGRTGQSTETETSTKRRGAKFEPGDRGIVVYRLLELQVLPFDAYYPSAPDDKSTMLICTPATVKPQDVYAPRRTGIRSVQDRGRPIVGGRGPRRCPRGAPLGARSQRRLYLPRQPTVPIPTWSVA